MTDLSAITYRAVAQAQEVLAEYIVPDSGISDAECVNRLLSILDHQDLVRAMRTLSRQEAEAGPVAWLLVHPQHGERLSQAPITDGDRSLGWVDTPLFASPSVPEAKVVSGVTVKPLEWRQLTSPREDGPQEPNGDWETADKVGSFYYIRCFSAGWELSRDYDILGRFDGPDAAKAAAQSDYQQRIMSALSVVEPVQQEGWKPIETVEPAQQVLVWEEMYGWLLASNDPRFGWKIKSSGNFWADMPESVVPILWHELPPPPARPKDTTNGK